jgi:hypothetical protein
MLNWRMRKASCFCALIYKMMKVHEAISQRSADHGGIGSQHKELEPEGFSFLSNQ